MSAPDATGWMPIETAPEFEAVLIAGGGILYPIVASYSGWPKKRGWWIDAQGECIEELLVSPTHWQPLPDLPISTSLPLTPEAATPTDSANPPPVESVGPNSEAQS